MGSKGLWHPELGLHQHFKLGGQHSLVGLELIQSLLKPQSALTSNKLHTLDAVVLRLRGNATLEDMRIVASLTSWIPITR